MERTGKIYYHGDDNGGLGTELRIFDGSSAKKLIQAGQDDVLQGSSILSQVSAPVSYFDGTKTVTKYFYLISTPNVGATNMHLVETDGTDFNTLPVDNGDAQAGMIMPYDFTKMEYVYFKNKFFFTANYGSNYKSYGTIYAYDYQTINATNDVLYMGKETESFSNLVATSDYLYAIDASQGGMLVLDEFGTKQAPILFQFSSNIKPEAYNNRIFAVSTWDTWNKTNDKLLYIDGVTPTQIDINANDETDAIEKIVVSGDKLFFIATPTGGRPSLYVMRADIENPTPHLIEDADLANYDITSVQAVEGGVIYTLYNAALPTKTKIKLTEGFSQNTIIIDNKDGGTVINGIDDIVVNNTEVYLSESHANGNDYNLLSLSQSKDNFATGNLTIKVIMQGTATPISGATVTINNGLYAFTGISDASGNVVFENISETMYSCTVQAVGYLEGSESNIATGTIREVELNLATNIKKMNVNTIEIAPNPVKNILLIQSEAALISIHIYSLTGSLQMELNGKDLEIVDLSSLTSGVY